MRAAAKKSTGSNAPQKGPPQATNCGCGLREKVVQEICKGWRTIRETEPPLSQAVTAWPNSCTTMNPNHEKAMNDKMSRSCGARCMCSKWSSDFYKRPPVALNPGRKKMYPHKQLHFR